MNTVAIPATNLRCWLIGGFTLLWVLDMLFTLIFVMNYGLDMEVNPICRELLRMGPGYFILAKVGVWFLYLCASEYMKTWIHIILVCIMLPVTAAGAVVAFV